MPCAASKTAHGPSGDDIGSASSLEPERELLHKAVVKGLFGHRMQVVDREEAAVIHEATRHRVELLENAVATAVDAGELPKDRQGRRFPRGAKETSGRGPTCCS